MPSSCCVPYCKGNYRSGPRVSVYRFPKDTALQQKWICAIKRKQYTPNHHSRVCELHFKHADFELETSYFDERSGRKLTAKLDIPRLKKGAIPSKLLNRSEYPSSSRHESPDSRTRLEENVSGNTLAAPKERKSLIPQAAPTNFDMPQPAHPKHKRHLEWPRPNKRQKLKAPPCIEENRTEDGFVIMRKSVIQELLDKQCGECGSRNFMSWTVALATTIFVRCRDCGRHELINTQPRTKEEFRQMDKLISDHTLEMECGQEQVRDLFKMRNKEELVKEEVKEMDEEINNKEEIQDIKEEIDIKEENLEIDFMKTSNELEIPQNIEGCVELMENTDQLHRHSNDNNSSPLSSILEPSETPGSSNTTSIDGEHISRHLSQPTASSSIKMADYDPWSDDISEDEEILLMTLAMKMRK